jgi:hypothetical protein
MADQEAIDGPCFDFDLARISDPHAADAFRRLFDLWTPLMEHIQQRDEFNPDYFTTQQIQNFVTNLTGASPLFVGDPPWIQIIQAPAPLNAVQFTHGVGPAASWFIAPAGEYFDQLAIDDRNHLVGVASSVPVGGPGSGGACYSGVIKVKSAAGNTCEIMRGGTAMAAWDDNGGTYYTFDDEGSGCVKDNDVFVAVEDSGGVWHIASIYARLKDVP